jgi:hypothetical protein
MSANTKQMMVVNMVDKMLDEEEAEGFAEELFKMFERRSEANMNRPIEMVRKHLEPVLEHERAVAGVEVLVDVARRVERMAMKFRVAQDVALADAFMHLGSNLLTMAKKRSVPIMTRAAEFRAAVQKESN